MRIPLPQAVEDGCVRELDGIPGPGRGQNPAVEDHERDELRHASATSAAARQIASNDCASSDAPPTSAPSTSGCDRSPRALSAVTEPPYRTVAGCTDLTNACAAWAISDVAVRPVPIAHTGS